MHARRCHVLCCTHEKSVFFGYDCSKELRCLQAGVLAKESQATISTPRLKIVCADRTSEGSN